LNLKHTQNTWRTARVSAIEHIYFWRANAAKKYHSLATKRAPAQAPQASARISLVRIDPPRAKAGNHGQSLTLFSLSSCPTASAKSLDVAGVSRSSSSGKNSAAANTASFIRRSRSSGA